MKNYKESRRFKQVRNAIIWFIDLFYAPFKGWLPVQTYRYAVCGGSVTVLGLVAYFLSYNFLFKADLIYVGSLTITRYIAAYIFSFFISFPVGFFLSKFVVFSESELKGRIQLFRYGVLQALNIFINWSLLHLFAGYFGFWATPSQTLTTAIIAVFSYFFQRNISFRTQKAKAKVSALKEEQLIIDNVTSK